MPWETVGSVDTGRWPQDEAWIRLALGLARDYLIYVCGKPPPGCTLEATFGESDLGEYPILGVWHDGDPPDDYARRCEDALSTFNESVDWLALKEAAHADHLWDNDVQLEDE
jgi:hypothetical protein